MQQTIHIFLKDVRRGWAYIAAVLALTAALTFLTLQWVPEYGPATRTLNYLIDLLDFLLPMAWWLAIAHVVHGECLVGDTQFWVTRPYSWKSLFAAKLLFCATWLVLPHLVLDWIVLSSDGFPPQASIPALLWRHWYVFCLLILPAFVLAAVTRGMRQFMLACFLLAIGVYLTSQIADLHPSNEIVSALPRASQSAAISCPGEPFGTILNPGGVMALLLWLYARRRTNAVRGIVLAAAAGSLVVAAWPPRAIVWTSQKQPAPAAYPEIAVVYKPELGNVGPGNIVPLAGPGGAERKVQVDIPIEWRGRHRDLLDTDLAYVSVEPERSAAWSSGWNWYVNDSVRGGTDWIEIQLAPEVFERLKGGPVTVRAVFGAVVYEKRTAIRLPMDSGWSDVPGFGKVSIRAGSPYPNLWWRVPLRYPRQKTVCLMRDPDTGAAYRSELSHSLHPNPALASVSPVLFYAAPFEWLGSGHPPGTTPSRKSFCEFTVERPVAVIRRDIEIPNIRLEDCVPGGSDNAIKAAK